MKNSDVTKETESQREDRLNAQMEYYFLRELSPAHYMVYQHLKLYVGGLPADISEMTRIPYRKTYKILNDLNVLRIITVEERPLSNDPKSFCHYCTINPDPHKWDSPHRLAELLGYQKAQSKKQKPAQAK